MCGGMAAWLIELLDLTPQSRPLFLDLSSSLIRDPDPRAYALACSYFQISIEVRLVPTGLSIDDRRSETELQCPQNLNAVYLPAADK